MAGICSFFMFVSKTFCYLYVTHATVHRWRHKDNRFIMPKFLWFFINAFVKKNWQKSFQKDVLLVN